MQKHVLWLCLLMFFLLGCRNTDVAQTPVLTVSPTPFPTSETVTPTPTRSHAVFTLTASEILSDSAKYEGLTVRLTGRYGQLSTVACSAGVMAHRSPADWLLASGEELLFARGFEEQFRFLLPPGLTMTVEGTWRKWRGPIGCGKRAMVGDIWFVDVERIIDPNPIARVTLTPVAIADAGTAVPTPIDDNTIGDIPTPTPPIVFDDPALTNTPEAIPTDTPVPDDDILLPTSTPILGEASATPTLEATRADATGTATAVSQATPTPINSTPASTTGTPTLTPTSSSQATETPTSNEPTPTPPDFGATNTPAPVASTPTPEIIGTSIVTLTEELSSFTLATETLADNQVHRWPIPVDLDSGSTSILTATVFSAESADLVIAMTDAQGNILAQQNNANGDTPELFAGFLVNDQTTYYLQISTANNTSASYVTTIMYDTEIVFAFQDVLDYDDTISTNIASQEEHFWLLEATAGDTLVIEAMPDANTDVFIELYDPDANRISPAFVNSGSTGVTEIYTRDLPEDGVYIIRIGEWAFNAGSYLIKVTEGAQ